MVLLKITEVHLSLFDFPRSWKMSHKSWAGHSRSFQTAYPSKRRKLYFFFVVCIGSLLFFCCWIVFLCMDVPLFVYAFTSWWTWVVSSLGLLWIILLWVWMYVFLWTKIVFFLFLKLYCKYMFNFIRSHKTVFQSGFTIFHSHRYEGFNFSISSPMFVIIFILDYDHSNRGELVSHLFLFILNI